MWTELRDSSRIMRQTQTRDEAHPGLKGKEENSGKYEIEPRRREFPSVYLLFLLLLLKYC